MLRARYAPPQEFFAPDPWAIRMVRYEPRIAEEFAGQVETMFALSNGYLGVRGMPEEGAPVRDPGVFLGGFYEHRPISYGEPAYGFPKVGQSMLNCPDGTAIKLFIDDEPFSLARAEIVHYERSLDFRAGILRRRVAWRTPRGDRLLLNTARLVSFVHRHLAAIEYEIVAEDGDADIAILSELTYPQPLPVDTHDPRLAVGFVGRVLHPAGATQNNLRTILTYYTASSGLVLGCGMDHTWEPALNFTVNRRCEEDFASVEFRGVIEKGRPLRIHKYLSYHYGENSPTSQIQLQTGWTLDRAIRDGFEHITAEQGVAARRFWDVADVAIEPDEPTLQQAMRWNLFQLLQASERVEGHGIGARGLTGQTYEGHYFWDTEIYVLPFIIYTRPHIARALLKHRYDMLDKARARARELSHRGAIFPWRTINGEEASAYYAAGTAQYHINADIAYAVRKYVEISGDHEFMQLYGAEIAIETARLWLDLGHFSERKDGRFCINGVTGPDEYTALVNNNYFTNIMARENLTYAARTARELADKHPDVYQRLAKRIALKMEEIAAWEEAGARMYLPYDDTLRIHPQDDDFLELEPWDFAGTPAENYPLLLHYHPLNLYRSQVIKQADTVLAIFLLSNQFTLGEKKRNFDYYDPLTTHDSSLSVCIQSIVASEIGYHDKALSYFKFAATMDTSDIGGNMMHGAHVASIGGTWMALVYGLAGLRDNDGNISFQPRLPESWSSVGFCLLIRRQRIRIEIDRTRTAYRLVEGDHMTFHHWGRQMTLTRAEPAIEIATEQAHSPARAGANALRHT